MANISVQEEAGLRLNLSVTQRPLLVHALHTPVVTHRYQWVFVLSFLFEGYGDDDSSVIIQIKIYFFENAIYTLS